MKKFIILSMSVILALSVFIMSACSKDEGNVPTSSVTSSSKEESSSTGKISRNFGSSTTSDNGGGNSGGVQTSTSNPTSAAGSTLISGESLYIKQTPVPEGTSLNASLLIQQINAIESVTPSNFRIIEATIADAEYYYNNELTPSERAEVVNYNDLVAAREHFNKLNAVALIAEFKQGVSNLPDAANLKNADVEQVYALRDMMEKNKTNFSANIENFAELEAKVTACYTKIIDSLIEQSFIAQDINGNGIMESSIIFDGKTISELTADKKRTSYGTFFSGFTGVSSGSSSDFFDYTDKLNPNPVKIWSYGNFTTLTFNADAPGTLTYYPRPNSSRTYSVSTATDGVIDTYAGGPNTPHEVEITTTGTVTMTVTGGTGYMVAIKFSYPNLG